MASILPPQLRGIGIPPKRYLPPMHVTISSLILSVLWSECKNRHGFLRSCLGFSLNCLIRFKCVRLTDEQLLEQRQPQLAKNGFRLSVAVDTIVVSDQICTMRATPSGL